MSNILCGIWKNDMQNCFLNKYTSICFMKKKLHKALILYLTSILET